jgi:mannose-6-phosphate isomerase-like protein (cupin superfamily)
MKKPPALLVTLKDAKSDPALLPSGRGARKIVVTEIYSDKEKAASEIIWKPPRAEDKSPVQIMKDTEVAVFTHRASQDRHYHKIGTEIYMVLEGRMIIEVEGVDYSLAAGDMIVVNPWAAHRVKPDETEFVCRVITANCGGDADKYLAEPLQSA